MSGFCLNQQCQCRYILYLYHVAIWSIILFYLLLSSSSLILIIDLVISIIYYWLYIGLFSHSLLTSITLNYSLYSIFCYYYSFISILLSSTTTQYQNTCNPISTGTTSICYHLINSSVLSSSCLITQMITKIILSLSLHLYALLL